ncbi:sodium channel protein Nach-like [Zootermopsis nevadensis]|uniref:sodium channel protein Nach-like n=1 Tax=Zootermopsis nevadensis TaxID=136037 RepID=UPI000B8E4404|nr:sodium channel protein Nach-like [Zootermopsis nevadensis]
MYYRGVVRSRKKPLNFHEYVKDYFYRSSIPGLRHLVHSKRHPLETILWLALMLFAVTITVSVITSNWQRYSANPSVVSLEKDFREWEFEFPAVTICYLNKVKESKAQEYIMTTWGVSNDSKTEYEYYMKFVETVVNMSYSSLENFKEFAEDVNLINIDMEDLIEQVYFNDTIQYSTDNSKHTLHRTMTANELGFCINYGSEAEKRISFRTNVTDVEKPKMCSFILNVCSAKFSLERQARVVITSAYEVPDATNKQYETRVGYIYHLMVKNIQTVSSSEVRDLPIQRRRCRYFDEPESVGIPHYTYKLCTMKCRRKLAIKLCGCSPPFYRQLNRPGRQKICNIKGLICLGENTGRLLKLIDANKRRMPCDCLPVCESLGFQMLEDKFDNWTKSGGQKGMILDVTLSEFGRIRYRRDVLFTFDDLLVSFGSTASFFMGCSILSIVETFYFFTIRLVWYLWRRRQVLKAPEQRRQRLVVFSAH